MKPKEQSWWNLERARLKELYDNDSDMPCGILIEFERCKAQALKDANKAVFDIQVKLEKVWSESWDKKVKELEQKHEKKIESLCKLFDDCVKAKDLCYNQKMQELRRVTDKRVADIAVTKEKVREETLKGNFYRWLKKEMERK